MTTRIAGLFFILTFILAAIFTNEGFCQQKTAKQYIDEIGSLILEGKYVQLAKVTEEMIRFYPETKQFYGHFIPLGYGYYYIEKGNIENADKQLRQALDEFPDRKDTIFDLFARAYYENGFHDKAIILFKKAIEANPDNPEVRYWYAYPLKAKGLDDEAEKQCRIYLDSNPEDYEGWWLFGNILLKEGKYNEAIDAYKKELKLNPETKGALTRISRAYFMKGDYADGIKYGLKIKSVRIRLGVLAMILIIALTILVVYVTHIVKTIDIMEREGDKYVIK